MPATPPDRPALQGRASGRSSSPGGLTFEEVAAPFPHVAVHVVQPPGVGGVTADRGRFAKIGPGGGAAEGLGAVEVRPRGVEPVAEGGGRGGAGAAGVLPLGLVRQPVLPPGFEPARLALVGGQLPTERLGVVVAGEVDRMVGALADVVPRGAVADGPRLTRVAGTLFAEGQAHDTEPLRLGHLVAAHPEAVAE